MVFQSMRHSLRLLQLAYTFGRNGASETLRRVGIPPWICFVFSLFAAQNLPKREGQRLCAALEAMGPTFIKLGQALSIRPDLVGEEVAEDLERLQDNLPPFPAKEAMAIIQEDLGKPLAACFSKFEARPVAAASIAQVHYGVTTEGAAVAIKVLRPGIRNSFTRDIELFYWIAERLEFHLPSIRRLKPVAVVETFEQSIQRELDLRMEAAAAMTLRKNMEMDENFYVPAVDWTRTARNVLTMERVIGLPVNDIAAIKAAGHDTVQLLEAAARSFFQQVFRDGFFHADLHPGNLFVRADGCLVAVDFGITGRLDRRNQLFIAEILHGFLNGDYMHVAKVHIAAGYVPSHHSAEDFALACMAIGEPIMGKPLQEISIGKLLGQLFAVSALFDMETQPQLLLLQKNMMLAEGVGRMLNPDINMWQLCQPLIEQWATERLSPKGRMEFVAAETRDAVQKLPEFFRKLNEAVACVDESGFKIHPSSMRLLQQERNLWHRRWWLFAWATLGSLLGIAALTL